MSVLDVLQEPWAVMPSKLEAMVQVYERHALGGERFDAKAAAAALGFTPKSATDDDYTVQNGVATITIDGVMAKKMDLFTAISGGCSTQRLVQALQDADADASVTAILLDIDSPGGEVDGTQQLGNAVAAASKPVIAFADGLCCSAAMWIASQCNEIWAASDTTQVGSISVVMSHTDRSKQNEARGVKVTHITTGKYKRLLNSDEPLSQDGLAYGQDRMDYLHTLFVDAVADGRGVDADDAQAQWADGRVYFAQEAVDNGLIDGIISKDLLVSRLASLQNDSVKAQPPLRSKSAAHAKHHLEPNMSAPFKTFATEAEYNAAIAAATDAAKPTAAQMDGYRAEGASAERARIVAVQSTPFATQYPEVVKACVEDGKSGKAEASVAILAAHEAEAKKAGANREKETPAPAAASVPDAAAEAAAVMAASATEATKIAAFDKTVTPKGIQDHQAKARSEGRTIGPAEAVAEMRAAAIK